MLKGVFFVKGKELGKQTYDPSQEDAAIVLYSSQVSAFISVLTQMIMIMNKSTALPSTHKYICVCIHTCIYTIIYVYMYLFFVCL